jgi:integrase
MPRLTKSNPKYRRHKASDRAFVELDGKRFYLGAFGSPDSKAKYNQLVGEYLLADRSVPASLGQDSAQVSIIEICLDYVRRARVYYQKAGEPTAEYALVKTVLKRFRAECGHLQAADFGPLRFKGFRQGLINSGLSRVTINHYLRHILALFRLGAENEKISGRIWEDLKSVPALRKDRSEAKERPAIPPAASQDIERLLPFLHPMVADMLQLNVLTAARPGELVLIRPIDIDRSGEVWVFRPLRHKTQHHGGERFIPLGPQAQAILAPYLNRAPESFCFCPRELVEQLRKKRSVEPKKQRDSGNRKESIRKRLPKRAPGDRFTTASYYNAIRRACRKPAAQEAGIKPFNPNQLRKRGATIIRCEASLEAAQVILGHRSKTTTERFYAEAPRNEAVEVIRRLG